MGPAFIFLFLTVLKCSAFNVGPVQIPTVGISPGGITITNQADKVTFGNLACKNCTDYINQKFASLQSIIQTYDNSNYSGISTCNECTTSGIDTISPYGDACVTRVTNQPNLIVTTLFLQIKKSVISCTCVFSTTVGTLLEQLSSISTPSLAPCNVGAGEGTNIAENAITGLTSIIPLPQSCSNLNALQVSVTEISVNYTVTRYNLTVELVVQKNTSTRGPNAVQVTQVKIVDQNFTETNTNCESSEGGDYCTCITDTGVFKTVADAGAEYGLTCFFKNDTNTFLKAGIDAYLSCDGLI